MNLLLIKTLFFLSKNELQHAVKVLKYKKNQSTTLIDGKGNILRGVITDICPEHCKIQITDRKHIAPPVHHIHIGICPTKNLERVEWFVEKTTEIGIQEISFIQSAYCQRKQMRVERIKKKAISSMKQSLRVYLPKINPLVDFHEFIAKNMKNSGQKFIAHQKITHTYSLYQQATAKQHYLVLIGPEGGFSKEELEKAQKRQFTVVSLGKSRLRVETAGIVTCHTLNLVNVMN